jgi:competence CoiA-like predicted nuclease
VPQKAITAEGKSVLAFLYKDKFHINDKFLGNLFCPDCKGSVFARAGINKSIRLHFAHTNRSTKCLSPFECHPETPEHETGKLYIYETFSERIKTLDDSENHSVDIEYPLPLCGNNGRKADVALLYKGFAHAVVECQLSPITQMCLTERILDYREQGIDSLWLLGGDANTHENRQAILKYTSIMGFIDIEQKYVKP